MKLDGGLTRTQISLLEALEYLEKEYGSVDNKALCSYYQNREGSGLPFFDYYGNLWQNPGTPIYRKTIYRNIKKLEALGLVLIESRPLGRKKRNIYFLTEKGNGYLEQVKLKEETITTLSSYLNVLQARFKHKLWTFGKWNMK